MQGLKDPTKRLNLFSRYSISKPDIYLLSETNRPSILEAAQWTQECLDKGLSSLFFPDSTTAIIWKTNSQIVTLDETVPTNSITDSLRVKNRSTDATFIIGDSIIKVMAVYVSVHSNERRPFLVELSHSLDAIDLGSFIIGGDWNCVLDTALDSSNPSTQNGGCAELKNLIQSSALTDAYRHSNPNKKLYTNTPTIAGSARRRLDRFYLSQDLLRMINGHKCWERNGSSHNPIAISFLVPGAINIGPGKFKFGLHQLEENGISGYLEKKIQDLHTLSLLQEPRNPLLAWNLTKIHLQEVLKTLSRNLTNFSRLTKEAESRDQQIHAGRALRARIDLDKSGRSSIHIRLKQVRSADLVSSIETPTGTVTTTEEMLEAAKDFFNNLYSAKQSDKDALAEVLESVERKIKSGDTRKLEKDFDMEELLKALKSCNRRSSPGPDGIPFELYHRTWSITGPILLDAINFIATIDSSELPIRTTHIHLTHKKGDHALLKNKRPISIMNTDERLFSQSFNKRIAPILESIVRPSQTGFIPRRWIGDNIAEMQCAMDGEEKNPGLVASMDFEKAYDRVSHSYMAAIFEAMGFGPKALRWISSTYLQQTAKIFLNGWLSESFSINSGVRQGDPLAPSLFAIIIEGFATQIRKLTIGMTSGNLPTLKESLFADDAVSFLEDYKDAEKLEEAISIYCLASGSRINLDKSFIYPLGKFRSHPLLIDRWKDWNVITTPFRHLGVTVGIGFNSEVQWRVITREAITRMRRIPMFDLPLAARCAIINQYCYSKILYYDKFSPASPATIKELTKAASDVIWGNRKQLVRHERLCTPLDSGGFGLSDLNVQLCSHRASWVFNIMERSSFNVRHLRSIRNIFLFDSLTEHRYANLNDVNLNRRWRWWTLFCHPISDSPEDSEINWRVLASNIKDLLPARWKLYFQAWFEFTVLVPKLGDDRDRWVTNFLTIDPPLEHQAQVPLSWFRRKADKEVLDAGSFFKGAAIITLKEFPLTFSKSPSRSHITPKKWSNYWKFLRKIRAKLPVEEDTSHLLSLGSLHPGIHVASIQTIDKFPHNISKCCILCQTQLLESLPHLFTGCTIAKSVWIAINSNLPHPDMDSFYCPVATKANKSSIALNIVFVHAIWRLSRSRRFSQQEVILQLDQSSIDKLAKKIELEWKYSGLHPQGF